MRIRQETSADYDEVYLVVKGAFEAAEHSDGTEQDLVTALRDSSAFVPELSLVAEIDEKIVGHIMFTKAEIGGQTELVLAPLSVLPEHQKQGIGSALIQEGHKLAKDLGYRYSVVVGSEEYYPRVGYLPAEQLGIRCPFEIASENFMAIRLNEHAEPISGVVKYAPEFGI